MTTLTPPASHTYRFLGTGASCGVPSFYCGCKACEEALKNPAAARSTAALLIRGTENTLIDAGPDLRMQLSLARASSVERLLLTHEHLDHTGGIPQLEFYVRLRAGRPLPLYAGEHTLALLAEQYPYMADTWEPHVIAPWQRLEFDGVRYTVLPAAHGRETFGFLMEKVGAPAAPGMPDMRPTPGTPGAQEVPVAQSVPDASAASAAAPLGGRRIAYFPDTGVPSEEVNDALEGVEVLIIDATFNGTNWMPGTHLSIHEAIAYAKRLGARRTFLTHLSMHYDEPLTVRELQAMLAPYEGAILAANDGLELPF